MRGEMATFPEMMRIMPDMMQDFTALETQIKALEKTKPAKGKTTS